MQKAVGIINIFFGVVELLIGVPFVLFTLPRLLEMYESMNVELPYTQTTAYFFPICFILLGIINLLVGFGNLNIIFKNKSELIYKIGMILVILSLITTSLSISAAISSFVGPIYTITNSL